MSARHATLERMASASRSVLISALALAAALAFILATPATGLAQPSPAAQALFDEGVSLRKQGRIGEACAKFEESLRLEATVGTRFNLADCFEKQGKLASAWSQFLQVASDTARAGEKERSEAAKARAERIKPRLSRLSIEPEAPAPNLVVMRNGVAVGQAQWGLALPIDGGEHRLEASAPGMRPWSKTISVAGEGANVRIAIPPLEDAPEAEPGITTTTVVDEGAAEDATPMVLGLTLGAIGLVGLGIGTGFGVSALSKKSDVDDLCPDLNNCTQEGIDTNDEAKTAATVSTIGFIAGGALLVTGIVLWVALPSGGQGEAALRVTPAGLSLVGRF